MMIGTKADGSQVAYYLPDDWWMYREDVCLYANVGKLCFVRRDTPGYWPVPTYEWPPRNRPPKPVTLSIADAEAVALEFNQRSLKITPEEARKIVNSSMQAKKAPAKSEGAPC